MATRRVGSSIETENDGIALTDVESGDGVTNPALDVSSDSGHGATSSTGPGIGRNPATGTASGPNHVSAKSPDADVEPEGYVRIKTIAEGYVSIKDANLAHLKRIKRVLTLGIPIVLFNLLIKTYESAQFNDVFTDLMENVHFRAIDTALIAANAGQLKFLFDVGSEAIGVTFIPLIVLLCVSLGAQLIVAVTLVKVVSDLYVYVLTYVNDLICFV